jgi:hypothetical protein
MLKCKVKLPNCSFGKTGDIVEIEDDELTERQKVMLDVVEKINKPKQTKAHQASK